MATLYEERNDLMFDQYDLNKLKEARENLLKVYEYNYGDTQITREVKRLETIIKKLDELIHLIEN